MNDRLRKFILLALAVVLLIGSTLMQRVLNRDRDALGLTRVTPLENAPPLLAFTTVALGGFRGLIANALWIRAMELQDEDKFFEMAQLADWITKLEPHFVQVWTVQAWNMSYNISVKFKDFDDRWRWVQRGISLLRDEGLKYNPNEVLIYRELAWQFQHKMGANLDDANKVYKQQWIYEMATVFGKGEPKLDELLNPKTEEALQRLNILTNKFKMDPVFMKQVDDKHGPLEWRLPEAHAIYWAALGLKAAAENPTKVKADELIQLRRVVYQSMQLSLQRGRLIPDNFMREFDTGPNLEIVQKVSDAYEQAMIDEPGMRPNIETAHRNLLGNAVYFLYEHDRIPEALKWYKYLGEKYPNKTLLADTNSFPANLTLEEFAVGRIVEDVSETSRDRVKAAMEGQLARSYQQLILGDKKRSAGLRHLAQMLRQAYMKKIAGGANEKRIGLPPVEEVEQQVLSRLLDPKANYWPPEMRDALRSALGMPLETVIPVSPETNSPPAVAVPAK
jgi:hypothetical protein